MGRFPSNLRKNPKKKGIENWRKALAHRTKGPDLDGTRREKAEKSFTREEGMTLREQLAQ
jgi:hypothetical protein